MTRTGWWRAAGTVAAKEIRSAFRDRQTRIYTLLMPLVMYPAMFWVALQAFTLVDGLRSARSVDVEIVALEPAASARAQDLSEALAADAREQVRSLLLAGAPQDPASGGDARDELEEELEEEPGEGLGAGAALAAADLEPRTRYRLVDAATASAADGDERADAALHVRSTGDLELVHDGSRSASRLARTRVEAALERVARARRTAALGAPVESLRPLDFDTRDVADDADRGAFLLSTLLPLMLIAMATMGAFFPAVDITAGERERKTFETTLLLPVPRSAVFTGQLVSVAVAALAATIMNLVGVMLAAGHLLSMLTDSIEITLPLSSALLMIPVMVTFALLLAATLTACAAFTETFKQGQALLGTVQMVFILPAMVCTLPGIQLTWGIAVIPVVGPSVTLREILRSSGDLASLPWGPLIAGLATSAAIAVASVLVAVRAMRTERATVPGWIAKLTGRSTTS